MTAIDWTYKAYAGIGSKRTPEHVLWLMRHLATKWALAGWTLRSGDGKGADAAFALGCDDASTGMPVDADSGRKRRPQKEIYTARDVEALRENQADSAAYAHYVALATAAQELHPTWSRLADGSQLVLMRGLFCVLGPHALESPVPVHFAVYWHDGQGETGQAVKYCRRWNQGDYGNTRDWTIDLRNLFETEALERALAYIKIDPADYRAQWALDASYRPGGRHDGTWPQKPDPDRHRPVWLLGHGGDPQPQLLRRLLSNGITEVIDVRPDPDAPDPQAPWAARAELGEHLKLQGLAYRHSPKLASDDTDARTAGAATLAAYLFSHPDERVALLDRGGHPDKQAQHARLLPALREHGVAPLRIWRDGRETAA